MDEETGNYKISYLSLFSDTRYVRYYFSVLRSSISRMFLPCFSHRTAKYTLLTFLPLNLLEQFRRVANAYFLIVLFLCYVMPSAPVDPNTWVTSVVFVFGITMVKQGYEDLRRYLNDRCAILNLNSVIH